MSKTALTSSKHRPQVTQGRVSLAHRPTWCCGRCFLTVSLYKVFGKVKFLRPIAEELKPFAGNLQEGLFAKTPLSAQLEILGGTVGDPNDPFYDVKQFTKPVSGGFMAGMGFELRMGLFYFLHRRPVFPRRTAFL